MILNNLITPDLIFSYWIFAWFIIYYLCIIFNISLYIKTNFNPLLALFIAFFLNFIQLCYITYKIHDFNFFYKFLFMILIIKGIPIYLIKNQKINVKNDLINTFIFFIFYNIYLMIRGTNIIELYKEINKSLIEKKNKTIIFKIFKYFNL